MPDYTGLNPIQGAEKEEMRKQMTATNFFGCLLTSIKNMVLFISLHTQAHVLLWHDFYHDVDVLVYRYLK